MRKRNIPANAYTYMGVLKSLALMRDGISAVQVITEMRDEKLVTPDKRHFAMAMFTCITGNQCYLAESLFTFYTKIAGKPDAALCSLNLRALLQQKKWDQAHAFFKLMEEGQYLSKPNVQTLNYLLQYQLLDERFPEAEVTLQKIFAMLFSTGTRSNPLISSLEGTYEALSILLGPYSAHMQRMVKQDSAYHQRMTIQGSTLSIIGTNSDTSIAYYCEGN